MQKQAKGYCLDPFRSSKMNMKLPDIPEEGKVAADPVELIVHEPGADRTIWIEVTGYETMHGDSLLVGLEQYRGELRAILWNDRKTEDPVIISLAGAKKPEADQCEHDWRERASSDGEAGAFYLICDKCGQTESTV